jgi:ssDNA-binding Zn-finger/Zn-ribbon topoisomerase 1
METAKTSEMEKRMSEYLKPCPWCGRKDVRMLHDEVCWFVWCNNDDCKRKTIKCFATEQEAREDWEKEDGHDA